MGVLYVKTHNKTGLKYLGVTIQKDPFAYKGSGMVWTRHIKKYGYDVTTEILIESDNLKEVAIMGYLYSRLWNVVASSKFANLVEETGWQQGTINPHPDVNKKRSESLLGVSKSEEHKQKLRDAWKTRDTSNMGKYERTPEIRKRLSESKIGNCPKTKTKEHREHIAESLRKTYIINGDIVVTNAKLYCKEHGYNYISFTQAAKNGTRYRRMEIAAL